MIEDEYLPSTEELAAEEEEEPLMMQNASRWENFIAYVDMYLSPWADEEHDTDLPVPQAPCCRVLQCRFVTPSPPTTIGCIFEGKGREAPLHCQNSQLWS